MKNKETCFFCQTDIAVLDTVNIQSGLGYYIELNIMGHGPDNTSGKICAFCLDNVIRRQMTKTEPLNRVRKVEVH
jgi:hypothetical protein